MSSGKYQYRLKQIDFNGNYEYHTLQNEVEIGVPKKFNLSQNYPNPFNPTTRINYELPITNYVSIKIYDINGKVVVNLVNENKQAGYYTLEFNGANLSSGMYFYRIEAGEFSAVKKMVLVK
ncbi:MAG: T9SS type A sorting domain-containing protein [Ignavibacteria bacterium]|nr:T9SS type A sorting domain-containing protein [Ignavibacteria bacterium]